MSNSRFSERKTTPRAHRQVAQRLGHEKETERGREGSAVGLTLLRDKMGHKTTAKTKENAESHRLCSDITSTRGVIENLTEDHNWCTLKENRTHNSLCSSRYGQIQNSCISHVPPLENGQDRDLLNERKNDPESPSAVSSASRACQRNGEGAKRTPVVKKRRSTGRFTFTCGQNEAQNDRFIAYHCFPITPRVDLMPKPELCRSLLGGRNVGRFPWF